MRKALLELYDRRIGMRRALVLLGNLCQSGISANALLLKPFSAPFSVHEIRKSILREKPQNREMVFREALKTVMTFINKVENKVSNEVSEGSVCDGLGGDWIFLPPRVLFTTDEQKLFTQGWRSANKLMAGIRLIQIPAYHLALGIEVLNRLSKVLPEYKKTYYVSGKNRACKNINGLDEWAEHLLQYKLCEKRYCKSNITNDSLPLPFGVALVSSTLRDSMLTWLRLAALRCCKPRA